MARKPTITDGPDLADLDGQAGIDASAIAGTKDNDGTTDKFTDPISLTGDVGFGLTGDDGYSRDEYGNIRTNKDGSPRKRRGRKAGGGNAGNGKSTSTRNNQTVKQGIESLSQTLMVIHLGIANLTKFQDFALDKVEADTLAQSTANVLAEFDWTPDPRMTAIAGLISTASMIYGPRYFLYQQQAKQKRKEKKADNVMAFTSSGIAGATTGLVM